MQSLNYSDDASAETGLGPRVRALRHRAGLSQENLADQLGFTAANLSAIESGRNDNPTLRVLTALASFFNTSIDTLVGSQSSHSGDVELMAEHFAQLPDHDRLLVSDIMACIASRRVGS